jgi:hypothetical protein
MTGPLLTIWPTVEVISIPSASLDCIDTKICPQASGPCAAVSGCADVGEAHRITWNHTGCVDASHHIAIYQSENGGGFVKVADNLSCNQANPDAGCCEGEGKLGTPCLDCNPCDGQHVVFVFRSTSGGQTTDYQYMVKIEADPGDTEVDSITDSTLVNAGGDTICVG